MQKKTINKNISLSYAGTIATRTLLNHFKDADSFLEWAVDNRGWPSKKELKTANTNRPAGRQAVRAHCLNKMGGKANASHESFPLYEVSVAIQNVSNMVSSDKEIKDRKKKKGKEPIAKISDEIKKALYVLSNCSSDMKKKELLASIKTADKILSAIA